MIVETETHVIPEQKFEVTTYIAVDGKQFTSKEACEKYEAYLIARNHPVFRTSQLTYIWPDEYTARLFNLLSESDYDYMRKVLHIKEFEQDDFKCFGPGYYLLVEDDCGDGPTTYRLYNVEYFLKLIELEFGNWKAELKQVMQQEVQARKELIIT